MEHEGIEVMSTVELNPIWEIKYPDGSYLRLWLSGRFEVGGALDVSGFEVTSMLPELRRVYAAYVTSEDALTRLTRINEELGLY